jgi:hypothetical protein
VVGSQAPDPRPDPVDDRSSVAPQPDTAPSRSDPTPPPRQSRRRVTGGDRRTTIDPKTQAAIQAAVDRLVAEAPPLTEEQRERLADLFSTSTYRRRATRRPSQ